MLESECIYPLQISTNGHVAARLLKNSEDIAQSLTNNLQHQSNDNSEKVDIHLDNIGIIDNFMQKLNFSLV